MMTLLYTTLQQLGFILRNNVMEECAPLSIRRIKCIDCSLGVITVLRANERRQIAVAR